MPSFKVHVNDKRICIAGLDQNGVLSAHINSVRRKDSAKREKLSFHVGALDATSGEHLVWHEAYPLRIGDKLSIEIVKYVPGDKPAIRKKPKAVAELNAKKHYARMLAKQLGWKIVSAK